MGRFIHCSGVLSMLIVVLSSAEGTTPSPLYKTETGASMYAKPSNTCEKQSHTCPALNISEEAGSASCTDGNRVGSVCTVSCKRRHVFAGVVGTNVITCVEEDGECPIASWNVKRTTYCMPLFCPDLPKLGNGSIECDRQFKRGSICKYSCNKGFELHPLDHEGHFCNKNAAWVGMPTPKCVERTTLKKNNGSVSSPGYPQNYNDDVIQSVYIEAERGHVIALKFQTFVTENVDENGRKTDFVRISDGHNVNANSFHQFLYGNLTTPFYLTSTTNKVHFIFTSNSNSVTHQGYIFHYQVHKIPPTCNSSAEEQENETASFETCNDLKNIGSFHCVRGCSAANLSLAETSLKTCIQPGTMFVPQTCVNPDALRRCQQSSGRALITCLRPVNSDVSAMIRSIRDLCIQFCTIGKGSTRYIRPRYCSNFRSKQSQSVCNFCRHSARCFRKSIL